MFCKVKGKGCMFLYVYVRGVYSAETRERDFSFKGWEDEMLNKVLQIKEYVLYILFILLLWWCTWEMIIVINI